MTLKIKPMSVNWCFLNQITKSKDLCDSNFQNFGHLTGTPNLEKSITNLTSNVTEAYCLCLKDKWSDELNDVIAASGVNKQNCPSQKTFSRYWQSFIHIELTTWPRTWKCSVDNALFSLRRTIDNIRWQHSSQMKDFFLFSYQMTTCYIRNQCCHLIADDVLILQVTDLI